jgi:diguanylate cyclase (GGDEF)-like protein
MRGISLPETHDREIAPLIEIEVLLAFLDLAPIGLIRFGQDGRIQLMNRIAQQLLMPFAQPSGLQNFFEVLLEIAPDAVEMVRCFEPPSGSICEGLTLPLAGGEIVYSLGIERITAKDFMAVVQDISRAVAQDRHLETLAELVGTDPLTRIRNRRAGEDEVSALLRAWDRDRRMSSFVMADIDHFKQINDTEGHEAGDEALVQLANFLKPRLRPRDVLIRWGGDEFLFLLPETGAQDALLFAERLRREIAATPFIVMGQKRFLSMSFGVAQLGASADDSQDVIKRADSALYAAKSNGRNIVMLDSLCRT